MLSYEFYKFPLYASEQVLTLFKAAQGCLRIGGGMQKFLKFATHILQ